MNILHGELYMSCRWWHRGEMIPMFWFILLLVTKLFVILIFFTLNDIGHIIINASYPHVCRIYMFLRHHAFFVLINWTTSRRLIAQPNNQQCWPNVGHWFNVVCLLEKKQANWIYSYFIFIYFCAYWLKVIDHWIAQYRYSSWARQYGCVINKQYGNNWLCIISQIF